MRAIAVFLLSAVFVFSAAQPSSWADEVKGGKTKVYSNEIEELKSRVTELENKIKNGVVTTDDTKLQSPNLLKVAAQGGADLPREMLDFKVSLGSYSMFISGPFSSPKFRPDTSSLVKAATEEKKTEVKEKLQQKLKDKFKLRR